MAYGDGGDRRSSDRGGFSGGRGGGARGGGRGQGGGYGGRDGGSRGGERRGNFGGNRDGERRYGNDRNNGGERTYGGDRPQYGDRNNQRGGRPDGDGPGFGAPRGEGRDGGSRGFGGNRGGGGRPQYGDRPQRSNNRGYEDRGFERRGPRQDSRPDYERSPRDRDGGGRSEGRGYGERQEPRRSARPDYERTGDWQRGGGGGRPERRDSDRPNRGGFDRRDGDRPNRGGFDRRDGDRRNDRDGRPERREGDRPNRGGFDRRDGDRPNRGGFERRDGDRRNDRDGRPERRDRDRPNRGGFEKRDGFDKRQGGPRRERPAETAPRQRTDLPIDEDVEYRMLPKEARDSLRGLNKEHAEDVGKLLIMSGRLLDEDPELAYKYSQEALKRAARIDVVREAAGIAAYVTERYDEALRELRTARRLSGSNEHLPLMADAERGLGRPEKALELANSPEADTLDNFGKIELAIVASGARADLGEYEAGLAILDKLPPLEGDLALRVLMARAAVLQAAGRDDEAEQLLSDFDADDLDRAAGNLPDPIYIYETFEEPEQDQEPDLNLDAVEIEGDSGAIAYADDDSDDEYDNEIVEAELVEPASANPDLKATWTPAPPEANAELYARLEREQGINTEYVDGEYDHDSDEDREVSFDDDDDVEVLGSDDDDRSIAYDE